MTRLSNSTNKSTKIKNNSTSNIAGVGGGTLLLMLAKNIPEPSSVKSWLIIIAPTVSVCLASLWRLLAKACDKYLQRRKVKKLTQLLDSNIEVALTDPNISDEEKEKLNKREKIFKDFHPLGLQVGLYDGVARGVIVVRTPEDCSRILYQIFTNSLEAEVTFEEHGVVLRERITNSVLRVMTGWPLLANTFWNNFHKTQNPKSGNCI